MPMEQSLASCQAFSIDGIFKMFYAARRTPAEFLGSEIDRRSKLRSCLSLKLEKLPCCREVRLWFDRHWILRQQSDVAY